MFLRCTKRKKAGQEPHYSSLVENKRGEGGRLVPHHVLYLGEINDSEQAAWRKAIEIFEEGKAQPTTVALFPEERMDPVDDASIVWVRLDAMALRRPRQCGACWPSCQLHEKLGLEDIWAQCLPPNRKGTRWDLILQTLVSYRLIAPGSEWRLHRDWFAKSALADLLGGDFSLAEIHKPYECLDRLVAHKVALFDHLTRNQRCCGMARGRLKCHRERIDETGATGALHCVGSVAHRLGGEDIPHGPSGAGHGSIRCPLICKN